jgi:hypothetical protein
LTLANTINAVLNVELSGGENYEQADNAGPLCLYCHAPGTRDPNSAGSPVFYFCTNRACTAPEKPHRWFKVR